MTSKRAAASTMLTATLLTVGRVSVGDDTARWTAALELGDAPVTLTLRLPGEVSPDTSLIAVLENSLTSGQQELTVDSWRTTGDEVRFRLLGLDRPYRFEGRRENGTIDGTLAREARTPGLSTDLYLLPVDTGWQLGTPTRITDREGYDNQPYFLPGGEAVLYTSMRGEQTDVYRYDLDSGETRRLTITADSEYSPTPMPDGSGFSCIRQTTEGKQYLWAYDFDGSPLRRLFDEIEPVGYHAWLDDGRLALFVLGEPMTLQIADLASGTATVRDESIGRALHRAPGTSAVTYVHKGNDAWSLRRMSADGGESETLLDTLEGSEDFVWADDESLLMGSGSTLYLGKPASGSWQPVADLAAHRIHGISRLALSPDGSRLVVVGERPDLSPFPETIRLRLVRQE